MTAAPLVGIGVIIINKAGEILVGKRIGSHAAMYSIPGGGLDIGEGFEQAAIREVHEETGLKLHQPRVIAITNNLETFRNEGVHSISVILQCTAFSGEPQVREPQKCSHWLWCNPQQLPLPHFDASRLAVDCYLNGSFYQSS
jgi:8-oxo-dGTP diphosphatase